MTSSVASRARCPPSTSRTPKAEKGRGRLPPPTRKFAVGDRVELSPGRSDPPRLPWQGTDYQYRVKHARDQHERVVSETELRRG